MSNRQRRQQARRHRGRVHWLWFGVGAVVVLALVVAVVASGGDDGQEEADGVEQVRAVEVAGDTLPAFDGAAEDAAIGASAPELRGESFDGAAVEVAPDGRGKVLVFLAHWCPHCQAEVPRIVDHLATTELPDGVDLVAVSTGVDENRPNYPASAWLERERWRWPVLVDDAEGSAAQGFGLTGFPYLVALDAEGRVVARASGEFSMEVFDAAVAATRD
jgi:cytochrome c biogenesis protein CcmG/thiol:disulfide interchange protein DsbE